MSYEIMRSRVGARSAILFATTVILGLSVAGSVGAACNRLLRGLRNWGGFRQIGVPSERDPRLAGESKYTLRRLVQLALSGYVAGRRIRQRRVRAHLLDTRPDFDDNHPGVLNHVLTKVFAAERHSVSRVPMPVGVTCSG